MIQLNLFKKSLFYLCFQAYSGKKVKNLIEVELYVKSAEEVLTDALMRDLEENSDVDEMRLLMLMMRRRGQWKRK